MAWFKYTPNNVLQVTGHPCRYKVLKILGDGTYGSVWKAHNLETNEAVRIMSWLLHHADGFEASRTSEWTCCA